MICRNRCSASIWIWRARSRVTPISLPTSSSVAKSEPLRPKRRSTTRRCLSLSRLSHWVSLWWISSSCSRSDGSRSRVSGIASKSERSSSWPSGESIELTRSLRLSSFLTSSAGLLISAAISSAVGSWSSVCASLRAVRT